jgi:hypothetical protein
MFTYTALQINILSWKEVVTWFLMGGAVVVSSIAIFISKRQHENSDIKSIENRIFDKMEESEKELSQRISAKADQGYVEREIQIMETTVHGCQTIHGAENIKLRQDIRLAIDDFKTLIDSYRDMMKSMDDNIKLLLKDALQNKRK